MTAEVVKCNATDKTAETGKSSAGVHVKQYKGKASECCSTDVNACVLNICNVINQEAE